MGNSSGLRCPLAMVLDMVEGMAGVPQYRLESWQSPRKTAPSRRHLRVGIYANSTLGYQTALEEGKEERKTKTVA